MSRFEDYVKEAEAESRRRGGTRPHYWYGFMLDRIYPDIWEKVIEITCAAEFNLEADVHGYERDPEYPDETRLLIPSHHPERLPAFLAFVKEEMGE